VSHGIDAVAGLDDVEAGKLELLRIQLTQLVVIFDEQNQRLGTTHGSIITRGTACDAGVNRAIQMIVSRLE
jgi:hypothetical protein